MNQHILDNDYLKTLELSSLSDRQLVGFLVEEHAFAKAVREDIIIETKRRRLSTVEIEELIKNYSVSEVTLSQRITKKPSGTYLLILWILLPIVFIFIPMGIIALGVSIHALRVRFRNGLEGERRVWRRLQWGTFRAVILLIALVFIFKDIFFS